MKSFARLGQQSKALLILIANLLITPAFAGISNADFSADFSDWSAEVTEFSYTTGEDQTYSTDALTLFSDLFSSDSGSATLSTGYSNDGEAWSVWLYQDLTLELSDSSNLLLLTLAIDSYLSSAEDLFYAQLRDLDSNDVLDLSAGGTFDVTDWVGLNLTLEFGLIDMDFDLSDYLTVSALTLTEAASDVPEPSALALFGFGLLALLGRRRRG